MYLTGNEWYSVPGEERRVRVCVGGGGVPSTMHNSFTASSLIVEH